MKNKILAAVKELYLATAEEIKFVLGDVKARTFEDNIMALVVGGELIRLSPEENSLSKEGFIVGPNSEIEDDLEVKKALAEGGYSRRENVIDWSTLTRRLASELMAEIKNLKEDMEKLYGTPKNLQLKYFDLSLKYHELYRLFYENFETGELKPCKIGLDECRSLLVKIEQKGTP